MLACAARTARPLVLASFFRQISPSLSAKCYSSSSSSALIYREYGDPASVVERIDTTADVLNKQLTSTQVKVKFLASPINQADLNTIQGVYAFKPPLPAFAGNEGVAEVIEVGPQVKRLKVGDWVVPSQAGFGTWRSHALGVEEFFVPIAKEGLDVMSVAQLTVNPCTAYRMLKDFVPLKAGDSVIQNGANSAVGVNVIQLAKEWGIRTINVIRSRPDGSHASVAEELKTMGANWVVVEEDLKNKDAMSVIFKELPKPKLALNCIGGKNATDCIRHLAFQGVMVTYGGMSKQPLTVPTGALIFQDQRFHGFWMTRWNQGKEATHPARAEMFHHLTTLMKDGKLKAPKTFTFKFEEFQSALQASLEPGFNKGKVTLLF